MKLPDPAVLEKVRQWLAYGDEDLCVARHGFSMPEGPPSRVIAFHAQQCAEKHLKAYLVFRGVDFPFTHNLRRLLDLSTAHAAWADTGSAPRCRAGACPAYSLGKNREQNSRFGGHNRLAV